MVLICCAVEYVAAVVLGTAAELTLAAGPGEAAFK